MNLEATSAYYNIVAGYRDEPVRLSYSLKRLTPFEGIFRYLSRLTMQLTVFITRYNFIQRFHRSTPLLTSSKTGDSLHFILNELNCDAGVPVLFFAYLSF